MEQFDCLDLDQVFRRSLRGMVALLARIIAKGVRVLNVHKFGVVFLEMNIRSGIFLAIAGSALSACSISGLSSGDGVTRGRAVYEKECASCHGSDGQGAGAESLGLGVLPPALSQLSVRNDGSFPHEFVRRFIMGQLESDVVNKTMPDFSKISLRHVYPSAGADGEILEGAFTDLLSYLESIQDPA